MIMIRQQQPHHGGKGFHPRNSWRTQLQSSGPIMLSGRVRLPASGSLPAAMSLCTVSPVQHTQPLSRASRVATCFVTASPNHRGESVPVLIPWLLMPACSHTAGSLCMFPAETRHPPPWRGLGPLCRHIPFSA